MVSPVQWGLPPDLDRSTQKWVAQAPDVWHFPREIWEPIWEKCPGRTIKIAILDTGVSRHPDLPEPIAKRSFIRGQDDTDPISGHGTHVAGTALGRNGIGAAPEAELIVAKVLSNQGSGGSDGIAAGIRWAAEQGADLISMSLGGGSSYPPTNQNIDYAWSTGAWVNCAAGNSGYRGSNTIGWPARYSGALCCGATQRNGSIAGFSSGGPQMDYAAPGQDIISCSNRGGGYTNMSGTSMATPWATGFWACVIQAMRQLGKPMWTGAEAVREFVKLISEDRGTPGHDPRFGHGVLDMQLAAQKLSEMVLEWF